MNPPPQYAQVWAESLFVQAHKQLEHMKPRRVFAKARNNDSHFWKVDSPGFGAQDCGGPFRQVRGLKQSKKEQTGTKFVCI